MGVRADYYTNGTLLTARMADKILPTAGQISISFDGASKETFEALRAGAKFEAVIANVKSLLAAADKLAPDHRPVIGFACTMMERNIDELPALVDLAADHGLDFVVASHVLPGTDQMQTESLFHYQDRAARRIAEAAERADGRQIPFSVQPLDQLIAKVAKGDEKANPHARTGADCDGVVSGLSGVSVLADRMRGWPTARPEGADPVPVSDRTEALTPADGQPDSIWACNFLWNRLYVGHEGNTAPCCLPGVPWLGDLSSLSLDEIWNGETETAMRIAMVHKKPAACCRGCQHIRELSDPAEIAQYLGGRRLGERPTNLPERLRSIVGLPEQYPEDGPEYETEPTLRWVAVDGEVCEGYLVQLSTDSFRSVVFDTMWHDICVSVAEFEIPAWVWVQSEVGQIVHWQALAILADERRVVGSGAVRRAAGLG